MKKMFNKAVLNGTTVMGDGLTYPRIPSVYTGGNEGGYQRGDMMDANAVVEMIKELTDTGEITIDELQNLINEEIQERVEGDQDQQRYTDQKIKDLIGTSPETLDTLKEIADALGEDPDFAANVWNKIAEVDQTLEDHKRASNLPKYLIASGKDSESVPIKFVSDTNGIHLNLNRTNLDTGDVISVTYQNAIPNATVSMPGIISSLDKSKIDNIPYQLVTSMIVALNDSSNIKINYNIGSLTGSHWSLDINIKPATSLAAGAMSAPDKQKLDSLVKYKAGNGIDITGNTISCTLDTSLYSIVTELPETGLPNKIYLLPSTKTEEGNIYTEYGYVNNKWEEIGKYKADVNLEPYKRALHLPNDVVKALDVQSGANYVNVYSYKEDLDRGILSEVSEFDIPKATSEKAGIITAQDKAKLDAIENSAQVNKIESVSVNGTPLDITNKGVDIPLVNPYSAGLMSWDIFNNMQNHSALFDLNIERGYTKMQIVKKFYNFVSGYIHTSNTLIDEATTKLAGVMSVPDKQKLDGIEEGAQVNTIESVSVNGTPLEITNKGVNIPNATTEQDGMMSANDKSKLDYLANEEILAYGVEWDTTSSDPHLTRIGNMSLHKTLPIQSQLKGCIAQKDKVIYWLNESDWRFRKEAITKSVELTVAGDVYTIVADIFNTLQYDKLWIKVNGVACQISSINTSTNTATLLVNDQLKALSLLSGTKSIELGAVLNGYDGTVRVYCPNFYIKSVIDGTKRRVWISTVKIDNSYTYQHEILIDAYRSTVLNTVPSNMGYLSTLQANSAISVVNTNEYCRGGDNRSEYDAYLETDPSRSDLCKPRTNMSRATMRTYSRNAGSEMLSYDLYKNIFYWLYVIEYANFNCQEAHNEALTDEGYKQGGLGAGITNMDSWSGYNGYYPLTPCGYGNEIGNGTGIKPLVIAALTLSMPRWRGFDNPFGDIWTNLDGIIIQGDAEGNPKTVYTTTDPNNYGDDESAKNAMEIAGHEIHQDGYTKEFDLGEAAHIIPESVGGDTTKYKCDYHLPGSKNAYLRTLFVGGNARNGTASGLGCFDSSHGVSDSNAYVGFRSVSAFVSFSK